MKEGIFIICWSLKKIWKNILVSLLCANAWTAFHSPSNSTLHMEMLSHKIPWILFSKLSLRLKSLCESVFWPVNNDSNSLPVFSLAVKLNPPLLEKCSDVPKWKRGGWAASPLWAADCQKVEEGLKRKITWFLSHSFDTSFLASPDKQFCLRPFIHFWHKSPSLSSETLLPNSLSHPVQHFPQHRFILSSKGTLKICFVLCHHCSSFSWSKILACLKQESA